MIRRLSLAAFFATFGGCVGELTEEGPCTQAKECRVGFECVLSYCIKCTEGGCGGLVAGTANSDESTLCGPDDACVAFPSGALAGETEIFIRRAAVQLPSDIEPRSLVYQIGPSNVTLRDPATVRIPISPSNPVDNIFIFWSDSPDGPWELITQSAADASSEFVDAVIDSLGYFVAARQR